jgi:hypothetical protein
MSGAGRDQGLKMEKGCSVFARTLAMLDNPLLVTYRPEYCSIPGDSAGASDD